MILYQVTATVPKDIHDEFIQWMQKEHLPKVMSTGCFLDSHVYRPHDSSQNGNTEEFIYIVHYQSRDAGDFALYQEQYAPALQNETREKFNDRIKTERKVFEKVQLDNVKM